MAEPGEAERLLLLVVAYTITAIWAVSYLLSFITSHEPNVAITPLMLTVATFAFGGGLLSKRKDGAGHD